MKAVRVFRCGNTPLSATYRRQFTTAAAGPLRRTALHETHVKEGATMVEFGGFQMPLQYKSQSISDSVNWTRTKASLFDVSLRHG